MLPPTLLNVMSLFHASLLFFGVGSNALSLPSPNALLSFMGLSGDPRTSVDLSSWSFSPDDVWQSVSKQVIDYAQAQLNSDAAQSILQQVDDFKTNISQAVSHTSNFQNEITQAVLNNNLTMDQLSDNIALLFNETLTNLQEMFPDPDTAQSHEARTEMVSATFDMISDQLVDFFAKLGIPQSEVENFIGLVRPPLETAIVLCGDLVQQHPQLFLSLAFFAIEFAIPETWFLRPLLSLFGFGPSEGCAQSLFFGAMIPKNSWFALLQSLRSTVLGCGRRK